MTASAPGSGPARPDLYVVARFLDRLSEDRAWTRSRLQAAVRLNYDLFRWYLAFLEARGFVEVVAGPGDGAVPGPAAVVRLTPEGRHADELLGSWIRRLLETGGPTA